MGKAAALEITQYFVLLALAGEAHHGYGIADQIIGDSVGGVYLRPSTLYSTIKRMESDGLIERTGNSSGYSTGAQSYTLTEKGRQHLASAAHMHERAARLAKSRLGLQY